MRIELNELHEGAFVEIRDPKSLKWKEQKELAKVAKEDDIEAGMDSAELIAIFLVKGGYILDENNVPFTFPLTKETVGELSPIVIVSVVNAFAEANKAKEIERKN